MNEQLTFVKVRYMFFELLITIEIWLCSLNGSLTSWVTFKVKSNIYLKEFEVLASLRESLKKFLPWKLAEMN